MHDEPKNLLLHVGLSKTGTTTLQNSLFSKHSQIYYLGKSLHKKTPKGCANMKVYKLLAPVLWPNYEPDNYGRLKKIYKRLAPVLRPIDKPDNYEQLKEEWHRLLQEDKQGQKKIIGSWEGLGSAPPARSFARIQRITEIFGDCRIMITIRNPLTRVPSQYLQHLKGNFLKNNKLWMGGRQYVDMTTWYNLVCKNPEHNPLTNYLDLIQSSISLLGKEKVGIFLFEEMVQDQKKYIRSVCEFIGIDAEEGVQLARSAKLNPRISQKQINYMRLADKQPLRFFHNNMGKNIKARLFKKMSQGNAAQVSLPQPLIEKITNETRAGHLWLVENLDMNLEAFGYPL